MCPAAFLLKMQTKDASLVRSHRPLPSLERLHDTFLGRKIGSSRVNAVLETQIGCKEKPKSPVHCHGTFRTIAIQIQLLYVVVQKTLLTCNSR